MARKWLEDRLEILIPKLAVLGVAQEDEVTRLCEEEIEAWYEQPSIEKESALKPVMSQARKILKNRLPVTPQTRWKDREGKYVHIALKHLNFSPEKWAEFKAVSDETHQERLEHQQLIDHPVAAVQRAERLLQSNRWDDLVVGLALVSGRRLTEILKTARFFPCTLYSVVFDGQLKRRDLDLMPYEIPVLVEAEKVLVAWRKLRALVDCTQMSIEQVSQKYSKDAVANADRVFAGLISPRHAKKHLTMQSLRAAYARIAIWFYCPDRMNDRPYASAILGHYHVRNEREERDALTTEHYFDYAVGDGAGKTDRRQGIRLEDPGVELLGVFQQKQKGDQDQMSKTTDTQGVQAQDDQTQEATTVPALVTKPHKTRGTLTTTPGTFDRVIGLMKDREMRKHDEIVVDLLAHDSTAHQMYELLEPLAETLSTEKDAPVATLKALIAGYQGGSSSALPGMGALLQDLAGKPLSIKVGEKPNEVEINSKENPIGYLVALVERDRKFQAALQNRSSKVDVTTATMDELRHKIKTTDAAVERFRRGVNAIIKHNDAQTDPLHFWYINSAALRDLVGGRNEAAQQYIQSRQAEIDAHHTKYNLTPKHNQKPIKIEDDVTVE